MSAISATRRIVDTVKELLAFNIQVDVEDPMPMEEEVHEEYGLHLTRQTLGTITMLLSSPCPIANTKISTTPALPPLPGKAP